MKEIISVESLSKDYIIKNRISFFNTEKTVKQALKNISFSIKEGEIVGYIGNNGAGKSTTIKLLLGILTTTKGLIKVFGKDPFENRQKNAKNIGALFGQKSHLWWDLPLIDSFD